VISDDVQRKLDALPASPGVYLFEDRAGGVLYVGKAGNLRSRVRSYFAASNSDTRPFIAYLEAELGDLRTHVVGNEKEAALLENELIKEHQPRYNVKLRDDKDFLSLRIDPSAKWPRLSVVRRPKPDGARYYGPIDSATSARQTLRQINRFFRLRTCKDTEFRARVRPCLQYQIKRCPAPCVKEVDRDAYLAQVDLVGMFLEGRHEDLVEDLDRRMREAAEGLKFEEAAVYRDQLRAVDRVRTTQRVATVKEIDQDVVGLYRAGDQVEAAMLRVRGGHLNSVRTFELEGSLPDDELLASFIGEYYRVAGKIPDEVLLPLEVEAQAGLEGWLSDERGKRVRVRAPRRGAKVRLVEMARENAEHAYREKARAKQDLEQRLGELKKKLRLRVLPRRIECVDVSHSGGQDTVAAVTAMTDGELDRRRYRSFRIKRASGGDDYAAMYEVLARRFGRGRDDDDGKWALPDLFVVDGGKGQLNVALAVLKDFGIGGLDVVGLAKEKREGGEQTAVERVFLPGQKNAIPLPPRSASRHLLTLVRDEAHRRSNQLRKTVGKRRRLSRRLDDVPGVGPKTKAKLLTRLGSMKAVTTAGVDELMRVGATRRQAEAIVQRFGAMPSDGDSADAERAALENAFEDAPT